MEKLHYSHSLDAFGYYHPNEKINEFIKLVEKQEKDIFEYALRNNAVPPIKGEITSGKVKHRGIKLIHKNNYFDGYERWLEQRGKRISDIVKSPTVNVKFV